MTDPILWALHLRPRPRRDRPRLEGPGALPMHWWVSTVPLPAVYDPQRQEATR